MIDYRWIDLPRRIRFFLDPDEWQTMGHEGRGDRLRYLDLQQSSAAKIGAKFLPEDYIDHEYYTVVDTCPPPSQFSLRTKLAWPHLFVDYRPVWSGHWAEWNAPPSMRDEIADWFSGETGRNTILHDGQRYYAGVIPSIGQVLFEEK